MAMLINEVENRVREVYPEASIDFDGYDKVFIECGTFHDTVYINSHYDKDPDVMAEKIIIRMEEYGC